MSARAVVLRETGGPERLALEPFDPGEPGEDEALVRQTAIGVNFIDTYHRSGLYPLALPSGVGIEAAGVVERLGRAASKRSLGLKAGTRVAYAGGAPGAYATHRVVKADRLVALPRSVSDVTAAAALLKGMTAEMLLRRVFPVRRGQFLLFHAAAGGVGLIAGQWARALGAIAIGTAGGPEKCALAKKHGYRHVIDYSREDFVERVRDITGGRGVPVVFDSVGKDTFERSFACLAPRGMLVSFGDASGPPPAVTCTQLGRGGSFFLTRPVVTHYTQARRELLASSKALFAMLSSGEVRIIRPVRYALASAARCHEDLEARRTTGSVVLVP